MNKSLEIFKTFESKDKVENKNNFNAITCKSEYLIIKFPLNIRKDL